MALLPIKDMSLADVDPGWTGATAAGDTFVNRPGVRLLVKNRAGEAIVVTIAGQLTARPGYKPTNIQENVPDGAERVFKTGGDALFTDTDGLAHVSFSNDVGVEVAVVR